MTWSAIIPHLPGF